MIATEKEYNRAQALIPKAFDLGICAHEQRHGDVTVYLTWHLETGEPCIVLTPTHKKISHETMVPCAVALSAAWKWEESLGDPMRTNMAAAEFVRALGFSNNDKKLKHKVIDLIRNYLGYLITLKPIPRDLEYVAADIIKTDQNTGSVEHIEVKTNG